MNLDRKIAFGGVMKAVSAAVREGYLVAFTDASRPDLQGEYFDKTTDFMLSDYPVVGSPVLFHHGLDEILSVKTLGRFTDVNVDDSGIYVKWEDEFLARYEKYLELSESAPAWRARQMQMAQAYHAEINKLFADGILKFSSGALPQSVMVGDDGHIKRWCIVEGSATPSPAEPQRTQIYTLKALAETTNPYIQPLKAFAMALNDPEAGREAADAGDVEPVEPIENGTQRGRKNMDQQMMQSIIDAVLARLQEQGEAPDMMMAEEPAPAGEVDIDAIVEQVLAAMNSRTAKADPEEDDKAPAKLKAMITEAIKLALPQPRPISRAETAGRPTGSAIQVGTKYSHMSHQDMLFFHELMAAKKSAYEDKQKFMRELADKTQKAHSKGDVILHQSHIKGINAVKADELDHSTQAGFGDEWVPDLWSSEIWRKIRLDNVIAPMFQSFDMPSNPYELPIEGTDPTVYFVPETTNESQLLISGSGSAIPDSKLGTGKVQIAAKKQALRVGFSSELEEDSIIPVVNLFREQAERAMLDSIDYTLLNGDTDATATTNINNIDGTPGATDRFLAMNGLRKQPLITTATNAVSAGGAAISLAKLRETRLKLPVNLSSRVKELAWIVDGYTYVGLLNMPEFITMDKAGPNATAQTGQIGFIDGIPVFVSAEMSLSNNAGKVLVTTPATNTFGTALLVYKPYWYLGYIRRIRLSVDYLPYYDANQLSATMRYGFVSRDSDNVALTYHILV